MAHTLPRPIGDLVKKMHMLTSRKELKPMYCIDDLPLVNYVSSTGLTKEGCHSGQRKLLMTEIQFLSNCAIGCNLIIYAGSAPCEHLSILMKMFPLKKFLLIDPNFHTPGVDFKYVYQNIPVISKETYYKTRDIFKHKPTNKLSTKYHHYTKAEKLSVMKFHRHSDVIDVVDVTNPTNITSMALIHKVFNEVGYKTLITDIINGTDMVYVIQDYMTRDLTNFIATSLSNANNPQMCFISDIRTNLFTNAPTDVDTMWNDALQLIFVQTLKPVYSMIKFHPPYHGCISSPDIIARIHNGEDDPIINMIRDDFKYAKSEYKYNPTTEYGNEMKTQDYRYVASEQVWLQTWAPSSSSEARLIISHKNLSDPLQNYNSIEWDNKFMYFRTIRGVGYFNSFYKALKNHNHSYDGCFDCMLEMLIITSFISSRATPLTATATIDTQRLIKLIETEPKIVIELLRISTAIDDELLYSRFVKCYSHGQVTRPPVALYFYRHTTDKHYVKLWQINSETLATTLVYTKGRKNSKIVVNPKITKYTLASNFTEFKPYANGFANFLMIKDKVKLKHIN